MKADTSSSPPTTQYKAVLSSVAVRVHRAQEMVAFYEEAFGVQFQPVQTGPILSQFGTIDDMVIKFVPIRDEVDFEDFPSHQLGFTVPDIEAVIELATQYGGRQEGELIRDGQRVHAAVRDPDGNTIELYTAV